MADKKDKKIVPLEKKQFNLGNYKAKNKLDDGVKDKELEYIPLSPAFQTVTGISVVKGIVNMFRGYTNTGKSTALLETIVGCQKSGILPVIIDTENSFNWSHARDIGFEFEEIVNEVTGEVENYEGFFIYVNNDHLLKEIGQKRNKDLNEAVIEDVAEFIHKLLDDQTKGDLDVELCFLWDSIGTLDCEKSVVSNSRNNMWNAGAMEAAFKSIINYRIPASRKENKKYTNTLVVVNKIWLDSMQGAGVIKNKGGEAMAYATRLIFHFGGIQSYGTKKLVAKADGKDYTYGTQTKVNVEKNHITGSSYNGVLISTAHGFILPEDIDKYKKEKKNYILAKLGLTDDSTDLTFTEEEVLFVDNTAKITFLSSTLLSIHQKV